MAFKLTVGASWSLAMTRLRIGLEVAQAVLVANVTTVLY
jgi:hypothetical protein